MENGASEIREHVERVTASSVFSSSARLCRFLRFIVERKLAGKSNDLKETLIGIHVFDRVAGYDTKTDAIVRVEARRLRTKLHEYYEGPGANDVIRITLPKGGYVPEFTLTDPIPAVASSPTEQIPAKSGRGPVAQARRAWTPYAVWASGAVLAALAMFLAAGRLEMWPPSSARPTMRPFTALQGVEDNPSFSPDDRMVAYIADGADGEGTDVYIRAIDEDEATPFTRTPHWTERGTAWSPDGASLAFLRSRPDGRMTLITKSFNGGREQSWGDVARVAGTLATLDWSPDGRYILATDQSAPGDPSRIVRFWLHNGQREWITTPPLGSLGDSCPAISPDGKTLAFRRARADNIEDVYVIPLQDDGSVEVEARRITFEGRSTRGHDWTPEGDALIVSLQRGDTNRRLWRVPLNGGPLTSLIDSSLPAVQPAVAHGSHKLLWVANFEDMNIWAAPIDGSSKPALRIGSTYFDMAPEIAPDGLRVAFRSNRTGVGSIWLCDRQGRNLRRLVDFGGAQVSAPRWSPDGQQLVFEGRVKGSSDLFLIPSEGGTPVPFASSSAQEVLPWWSKDGQSIYFASDSSGDWQIWRQTMKAGTPVRVTQGGGFAPRQSPDGKWLYYTHGPKENGLYRLPLEGGAEESVLPGLESALWGNWGLAGDFLYYVEARDASTGARAAIIERHLISGKNREVAQIERLPARFDTGLAVAPDRSEVFFAQLDRAGSDLFLTEGFR